AEELNALVKRELETLPVKYRLPLVLHYFGGMSQDDMAKELGCRPGTLRVRLHRGRQMLAKQLAKQGVTLGAVALAVALTRAVQMGMAVQVRLGGLVKPLIGPFLDRMRVDAGAVKKVEGQKQDVVVAFVVPRAVGPVMAPGRAGVAALPVLGGSGGSKATVPV